MRSLIIIPAFIFTLTILIFMAGCSCWDDHSWSSRDAGEDDSRYQEEESAQICDAAELGFDVAWSKSIGTNLFDDDFGNAIIEDMDGNYIVAGSIEQVVSGRGLAWVGKFSPSGVMIWQYSFNGIPGSETANSVCEIANHGYVLAASSDNSECLVALNSQGEPVWEKIIEQAHIHAVESTEDGGFVAVGKTDSEEASMAWIAKMDEAGNLEWQTAYRGNFDTEGTAIMQTLDGGYILVANDTNKEVSEYSSFQMEIIKISDLGIVEWQKRRVGSTSYGNIVQASDGGYAISFMTFEVDSSWSSTSLVKMDAGGNTQWRKEYLDLVPWSLSSGLRETRGGGWMIATSVLIMLSWDQAMIMIETDATGNLLWMKGYHDCYDYCRDYARAIHLTGDGSCIVAGTIARANHGQDIWVMRLDSQGDISADCPESIGVEVSTEVIAVDDAPLDGSLVVVESNVSVADSSSLQMQEPRLDVCAQCGR